MRGGRKGADGWGGRERVVGGGRTCCASVAAAAERRSNGDERGELGARLQEGGMRTAGAAMGDATLGQGMTEDERTRTAEEA